MSTVKLHYKNIAADAATYVGEPGSVFFDPTTSQLRVGDGVTPGGHAVTLDIGLATHDDATYINNLLFQQQGTGFATGNDSLHVISGKITAMAAGSSLAAVQSTITTAVSSTGTLVTGAGFTPGTDDLHGIRQAISTLQTSINSIKTHLGI